MEMSVPLQVLHCSMWWFSLVVSACKRSLMSLQCGSLHAIDQRGQEYTGTDASQKMTPKCQLSLKFIL